MQKCFPLPSGVEKKLEDGRLKIQENDFPSFRGVPERRGVKNYQPSTTNYKQ
jgi:hypothetical protein